MQAEIMDQPTAALIARTEAGRRFLFVNEAGQHTRMEQIGCERGTKAIKLVDHGPFDICSAVGIAESCP